MLIYVRVLCPDFKVRTFFWAAVYVECGTAQGLFECIEAHCEGSTSRSRYGSTDSDSFLDPNGTACGKNAPTGAK